MFTCQKDSNVFSQSESNVAHIFWLIHVDIWCAYWVPSLCGACYFLTIIGDNNRVLWAYLMLDKKEASRLLLNFTSLRHNLVRRLKSFAVIMEWSLPQFHETVLCRKRDYSSNHLCAYFTSKW